ncbi:hypothetical protein RGQ15_19755 [Paracoccus sp. MBLB3053]|uniref:DUF2993 domain-containing protein n=1 Tax=Paracoccus aurantius TaxID=3073814 RepID=A0ABU2HXL3_9RHOB|nr:hypothetical protein [Paracoccus sp. MBLB3053]MDS9469798.1 hypothetical protein [Paracoccus sp. MBLB3053]
MNSSGITSTQTEQPGENTAGLASLIGPALKRVDVAQVLARSGLAGSIGVGRIELGRATIDRVDIENVHATLTAGQTRLQQVSGVLRIIVELRFRVFGIGRSRSGELSFPFSIGEVIVPQLNDIAVDVPSASLSDAGIDVQPVADLDLGAGQFSGLRIDGTQLPAAGFGLDGIGLGAVRMRDLAVPATFTEALSIERFAPDQPLRLPGTVVTGVQLPDVDVPAISSSAPIHIPNITPTNLQQSIGFDLIILSVRLFVRPVIDIRMSSLTISDIDANSSIGRIAIENIRAPVTLHNLRLGELELREVTINEISI